MSEFQPPINPNQEANIRQIMEDEGISFEDARRQWEMMKAESELNKLKRQSEESEENTNE